MSPDAPDHADDPAERKMRFLFALRSRGVTDARVLTAEALKDAAAAGPAPDRSAAPVGP